MCLLTTCSKLMLILTLLATSQIVSANLWMDTALAANSDLYFLNIGNQQDKSQSTWDYIFRRRSGGSTRGPICVVAPDGGYVWHREPLFIWFGGEGELRVEVRGSTTNDVRWTDTISIPEGSGAQAIHFAAYDKENLLPGKENLQPGEEYYFGIYRIDNRRPLIEVQFQLLPQAEWQTMQTALISLSNEPSELQIWQRMNYFSSHKFTLNSGLTEAGPDSETYFLADALQEFFNLSESAEKDAYAAQIYTELCARN